MPSQLTRVVFRSIIANKPLSYRGCLYRPIRAQIPLQNGVRTLPQSQRRTFFNFLKPQRKTKSAELPPGLGKLMEVTKMQRMAARPPPPAEVAEAFNAFFSQKDKTFEDFHIQVALNALLYLKQNTEEGAPEWLQIPTLEKALGGLMNPPDVVGDAHVGFARALYEEMVKRRRAEMGPKDGESTDGQVADASGIGGDEKHLLLYVRVLSMYGASLEAKNLVSRTYPGPTNPETPHEILEVIIESWNSILEGFAREDNAQELLKTAELIQELQVPFVSSMQNALVEFFAKKKDLEKAKFWFSQPVAAYGTTADIEPHQNTHALILEACALNGDLAFGQQVVAALLKTMPDKAAWDAIFLWSAAIGKGVDEVDRMMNVMARRVDEWRREDQSRPLLRPDVDTINILVELCISKNDSYSAERYIALGEKRGIAPNAATFTMQMQYRLSVGDIDGARAAYFGLQGAKEASSVAVTNQLVRAMCNSRQHHFDDIMVIVDDLHEHRARFEPETVAALSVLHLRRGEVNDAIDLLQVHAHHFGPAQRNVIQNHLVDFLFDRENSTADAWDTYQMLRTLFPETTRSVRIRIMNEFFDRKRSDMACHIFFHMRNHLNEAIAADRDVYVAAFAGFARNKDAESLELAHNQLKLDLNVELDTRLRNALMLAHAATGNNKRALEYWAEIVASSEGPTYNSIAIAFRSCEGMPWGDQHAKPIWRRLKEMEVDIDKQIFTAYLGAIARNHLHDEAVAMVESVEDEYGFTPDLYM
jgi:hypothetical protein